MALRFTPAFVAACLLITLAACKHSETPSQATGYDMRGIIERLGTDKAPRTLIIRHEADKNMTSMAMPFYIDENVPLNGLVVGDKVAFHIETDPATSFEHVTKLQKLSADTPLNIPVTTTPATSTGSTSMKGMGGM